MPSYATQTPHDSLDAARNLLADDLDQAWREFHSGLAKHPFCQDEGGFEAVENGKLFHDQLNRLLHRLSAIIARRFRQISLASQHQHPVTRVQHAEQLVHSIVLETCNPRKRLRRTFPALLGRGLDFPPGLPTSKAVRGQIRRATESAIQRARDEMLAEPGFTQILFPLQPASSGRPRRARRRKCQRGPDKRRCETITALVADGLTGIDYCKALDDRRIPIPSLWVEQSCPGTYVIAYKDSDWRKRIQDEKSRHAKHRSTRANE